MSPDYADVSQCWEPDLSKLGWEEDRAGSQTGLVGSEGILGPWWGEELSMQVWRGQWAKDSLVMVWEVGRKSRVPGCSKL